MPSLAETSNNEITMSKNRVSQLVCLVVAVMIAGCAHKPVNPAAATSQTDAVNAESAAINPTNPDDIIALSKRLTQNRLTLYSVAQGQYTFYVGGVLSATYETATEILRISALAPGESAQVCEYSPQGVLFVDPKIQSDKNSFVNGCNQLVLRLHDYLS
jgi:hypothetical protein